MTTQLFNFDDIHVRSMTVDGLVYFAAKEIGQALEYVDVPWAIKAHVDPEYTTTFGELQRNASTACLSGPGDSQSLEKGPWESPGPTETRLCGLVDANLTREKWLSEPGLYSLVLSSKKPSAKRFKKFVFEEVLPTLRQKGAFAIKSNQMQLLNETDLHESVVRFIRANYPSILMIAGLGQTQSSDALRIQCWRKGYCKGQPDLMIPYKSGRFCGLAIELKTPAYYREPAPSQQAFLDNLHRGGWDVMVSSCYDEIIMKIVRYCDKVVAKRKRTSSASSRAASEETPSL